MTLRTRLLACGVAMAMLFVTGLAVGLHAAFARADQARPAWHQAEAGR